MRVKTSVGVVAALALATLVGCAPQPPSTGRVYAVHELETASRPPPRRRVYVADETMMMRRAKGNGPVLIDEDCRYWPNAQADLETARGEGAPPDAAMLDKVLQSMAYSQAIHIVVDAEPVYSKAPDGGWRLARLAIRRVVRQDPPSSAFDDGCVAPKAAAARAKAEELLRNWPKGWRGPPPQPVHGARP
jgi:hypothetical protein